MLSRFPLALCASAVMAVSAPALADLTLVSLDRTLSVFADTPDSNAFAFEQSFNTPSLINETLDGFGFVGSNFLAGSTTQRSEIFQTLPPHTTSILQGSASLFGNISDEAPLDARARSSITYTFSVDVETEVRIIWALQAEGLAFPSPVIGTGPALLSLVKMNGEFASPMFQRAADVGELNEGAITQTFGPGTYTLRVGAFTSLIQGDLLSGGTATLPGEPSQSAGYTVLMAVVPAPAPAVPLAIAGLLVARRRRA